VSCVKISKPIGMQFEMLRHVGPVKIYYMGM